MSESVELIKKVPLSPLGNGYSVSEIFTKEAQIKAFISAVNGTQLNESEFLEFRLKCIASDANPMLSEAYPVVFSKDNPKYRKMAFVISVGKMIQNARNNPECDWMTSGAVYEGDEFVWDQINPSNVIHRPVVANRGKLIAAYAIGKRKGSSRPEGFCKPIDDWKPKHARSKDDKSNWDWMPDEMGPKNALRKLIRHMFPFAEGTITPDEIGEFKATHESKNNLDINNQCAILPEGKETDLSDLDRAIDEKKEPIREELQEEKTAAKKEGASSLFDILDR